MALCNPICAVCHKELTFQEIDRGEWQHGEGWGLVLCNACVQSCKDTTALIEEYNRQSRDRELTESNRTETGRRIASHETAGRMVPVQTTATFGGFMETIYVKYNEPGTAIWHETKANKFWGAAVFMAGEHLSWEDQKFLKRLNIKW